MKAPYVRSWEHSGMFRKHASAIPRGKKNTAELFLGSLPVSLWKWEIKHRKPKKMSDVGLIFLFLYLLLSIIRKTKLLFFLHQRDSVVMETETLSWAASEWEAQVEKLTVKWWNYRWITSERTCNRAGVIAGIMNTVVGYLLASFIEMKTKSSIEIPTACCCYGVKGITNVECWTLHAPNTCIFAYVEEEGQG